MDCNALLALLCVCVAELQQCLLSAGDVGCGTFQCFTNNSCEIRGLHDICSSFLHNAGKFDSQVRSTFNTSRLTPLIMSSLVNRLG